MWIGKLATTSTEETQPHGSSSSSSTSSTRVEENNPLPSSTSSLSHVSLDSMDPTQPYGDLIPYADPSWYLLPKSPYYNVTHMQVRHVVRTFVDQFVMHHCHQWDQEKRLPRDLYVRAGKLGLLQCVCGPLQKDYLVAPLPGGVSPDQWDVFHEMVICDELSRAGSGGFVWGLIGGLGIGIPPILMFGSTYLKEKVVRPCFLGQENCCLCVTEPYAGSDVANIRTTAVKSADHQFYIVNGEKKWITNGTFANYFTVACRTGGPGMHGISLLLIERSMKGVKTRQLEVSGVLSSGTSFISFEDVKVPVSHLIGEENKGFKYIMYNFNHERMGIVIQSLRFSRVCFEEAMKHASKRSTFGKTLIQHDVIRQKLALMAGRIESGHAWMESLLYQTMQLPQDQAMLVLGGPIALLKAQATLTFEFCAREAAQIFGGLAYTKTGPGEKVERLYREVRAYAIPGGSEEIMLNL
ncbi:hypothetical protein HMI55_004395, partial [Coelomomyces lativittatus]